MLGWEQPLLVMYNMDNSEYNQKFRPLDMVCTIEASPLDNLVIGIWFIAIVELLILFNYGATCFFFYVYAWISIPKFIF